MHHAACCLESFLNPNVVLLQWQLLQTYSTYKHDPTNFFWLNMLKEKIYPLATVANQENFLALGQQSNKTLNTC